MRNLEFELQAFDDLTYWVQRDHKKARRILQLLSAVRREPFAGIGKPLSLSITWLGTGQAFTPDYASLEQI